MSIASRSSQPPVLKPGEWWVKHIGPIRLRLITPDGNAHPIERDEEFIFAESRALEFLASLQRAKPEVIKHFLILAREPEVTGTPSNYYRRSTDG